MPRKITAIQVNTSPVRYVQGTFKKLKDEVGVELTDDKDLAQDFGTMQAVEAIIPKIFNPFERIFKAVQLEVTRPERIGVIMEDLMS